MNSTINKENNFIKRLFLVVFLIQMVCTQGLFSQGFERVIVETYFENTGKKIPELSEELKTYRIYIDLEPEYRLQSVYGAPLHPFRLETSTTFFNHKWGNIIGDGLASTLSDSISYMLDTYITIGAATDKYFGIPLMDDKDGSIFSSTLFNNADGLTENGRIPEIVFYELDKNIFTDNNSSIFESEDFLIGVFGGAKGPDDENRILIAQLTTDGDLSFELNIQIAKQGEDPLQFTAREYPDDSTVYSEELSYGKSTEL